MDFRNKICELWSTFMSEVTVNEEFIKMMEARGALTRMSSIMLLDCATEMDRCMDFLRRMEYGDSNVCKPALIMTLIDLEYKSLAMKIDSNFALDYIKLQTGRNVKELNDLFD